MTTCSACTVNLAYVVFLMDTGSMLDVHRAMQDCGYTFLPVSWNLLTAARQPLRLQPAKMAKLEVISDGPWSAGNRSNRNWDIGCGLAGPDYDPGKTHTCVDGRHGHEKT